MFCTKKNKKERFKKKKFLEFNNKHNGIIRKNIKTNQAEPELDIEPQDGADAAVEHEGRGRVREVADVGAELAPLFGNKRIE